MVPFPDLHRADTLESPAIAALSGVIAAALFPFSRILALLAGLPAIAVFCHWIYIDASNAVKRIKWSMSFDGRLSARRALQCIRQSPDRFILYIQFYSGGFDIASLRPAAVLENVEDKTQLAIFPPSWKIVKESKSLGVTIRDCDGREFEAGRLS